MEISTREIRDGCNSAKFQFCSPTILYGRGLALPSTSVDLALAPLSLPATDTFVTALSRSVPPPPPSHGNGGQTN